MISSFTNTLVAFIIPLILIIIIALISARTIPDREKTSPFECGFDPKNKARLPFSIRFFLLAVIFLVFDIEIALLLPLPLALKANLHITASIRAILFLLILIAGLLHE